MNATHNVVTEETPETYEQRAAKRRTRREEKAAKRAFEFLKGKVRSQLRKQLDDIMKPNINDLILALAGGKGIRLQVEVAEVGPPVTVPPQEEPAVERAPLIIVP